jgi:GAF domain-containing protein
VEPPLVPASSRVDALTREQLETLLQLSQAFNSTLDVEPLLHSILARTLAVTETEAGALWVLEGDALRCTHAVGPAAAALHDATRPASDAAAGEALRTRAPVLAGNALDDPRYAHYRSAASTFRTRSAVSIPLFAVGEPLAVLEMVNDVGGKDEFNEGDVAFLELVADDAAAALRNARLLEAARRTDDLRALLEVSHEITATFDLERVLYSVVNLAGRALRFDRCVIAVHEGGQLRVRAISGEAVTDPKAEPVRTAAAFMAWAAERREAVVIEDTQADDEPAASVRRHFADYLAATRARSLFALPIEDGEGEVGQLLFEFREPNAADAWTREAAGLLANQAALAIRNTQLYAGVPFIAWLEPLAQRRRAFASLPRSTRLRWGAAAVLVLALLFMVRVPLRVRAADAAVHAGTQRPARAATAGTLADVLVREGELVEAGQVVARVRDDGLQLRLADAEGDLRLQQRAMLAAEATGDPAGAAAARLQAMQIYSALTLLREQAAHTEIRAPASGVVLTPRLEEQHGTWIGSGQPVLWIGDPETAEIRLLVPQHDVDVIRPGDRVRVKVPSRPDRRFEGRVIAIAPRAEVIDGQPLYTVRAEFDNADRMLRPGMSARARVLTAPQPLARHFARRPWRFIRMHAWW